MTDPEIYALENKHPGLHGIDSEANGLKYMLHDGEKGRIAIGGQLGVTVLSVRQAAAMCRELPGVLRDYFGVDAQEYTLEKRLKK